MKSNKASEVDGLPHILFKKVINGLIFPLSLLLQSFFSVKKIPTQWKYATVTADVKNYRPISLTCTASKLIVLDYLKSHKADKYTTWLSCP